MNTVSIPAPMKVAVAASERGDNRATPQTPWPLVQPAPMPVPLIHSPSPKEPPAFCGAIVVPYGPEPMKLKGSFGIESPAKPPAEPTPLSGFGVAEHRQLFGRVAEALKLQPGVERRILAQVASQRLGRCSERLRRDLYADCRLIQDQTGVPA